ncbi:MAG: sigma-70 family RNA polymerase sigma factor [Gemmataceae bacterium]
MNEEHLSQITTQWTMLFDAHRGPEDAAQKARKTLMLRYCGAVYRYLARVVRDPAVAEELTQEFALRFLQGKFAQADPNAGKFRSYVKTSLFRLVQDHYRTKAAAARQIPFDDQSLIAAPDELASQEQAFRESWRQELLARAWRALEAVQQQSGQPYYTVMRLRVDYPDDSSTQLAERLAQLQGKACSPAALRQCLHRARERFAELLYEDVRTSLEDQASERIEEELADLHLLKYCQELVERQKK